MPAIPGRRSGPSERTLRSSLRGTILLNEMLIAPLSSETVCCELLRWGKICWEIPVVGEAKQAGCYR